MIYHITTKPVWLDAKEKGIYSPHSIKEVGFIHCSTKEQVLPTVNRRYKGSKDLLLLVIDPQKVAAEVKFEDLKNIGEKHPHIYGDLPLGAVDSVLEFKPKPDGSLICKF